MELATRCALGAWEARGSVDATKLREAGLDPDSFEIGYRTAAGELALILRAMRKGEPPGKGEMKDVQESIEKDVLE